MSRRLDNTPEVAMVRRVLAVLSVVVLIACVGCQSRLNEIWSFGGVRQHAARVDSEVDRFRKDINDILFGLEAPAEPPLWHAYQD